MDVNEYDSIKNNNVCYFFYCFIHSNLLLRNSNNLIQINKRNCYFCSTGTSFYYSINSDFVKVKQDDIITEIAILAYDSNLNEIPQSSYHGAIKKAENLPDNKNPAKIILEIKQGLQGLIADDKVNRLIMGVFKDLRKAPSFQGGDAFKEIFKKRMSIFLQKHYPDFLLHSSYWHLTHLLESKCFYVIVWQVLEQGMPLLPSVLACYYQQIKNQVYP